MSSLNLNLNEMVYAAGKYQRKKAKTVGDVHTDMFETYANLERGFWYLIKGLGCVDNQENIKPQYEKYYQAGLDGIPFDEVE